jgi:hypothetical protein
MNPKKRLFRLIEVYLNEYRKNAVEEIYGKGTKIKIHTINHSITTNSLLVEAVICLGDIITEEVMDRELADIIIQEALDYFYPECSIKTMIRWDV